MYITSTIQMLMQRKHLTENEACQVVEQMTMLMKCFNEMTLQSIAINMAAVEETRLPIAV